MNRRQIFDWTDGALDGLLRRTSRLMKRQLACGAWLDDRAAWENALCGLSKRNPSLKRNLIGLLICSARGQGQTARLSSVANGTFMTRASTSARYKHR